MFEAGESVLVLSFDPMNNSRLFTNIGFVNLDSSSAIDDQPAQAVRRGAITWATVSVVTVHGL